MKTMVLGSEGFIGKHLMEQGRAMGHDMVGVDVAGAPDIRMDVGEIDAMELIEEHIERVIWSAGILGTQELIQDPLDAVEANIVRLLRVLEECRHAGTPFTYITLGNNWLNPYSITKNCAADFCRMYLCVHDLPVQVAVTYNVFGPYQKWKPVRKIIPEFMTKLIRGEAVDLFFDGKQKVDLVYAPDVARAILEQHDQYGTVAYGSATAITTDEALTLCAKSLGLSSWNLNRIGPRPGETGEAAIAAYPMKHLTPIDEALKVTADWYRKAITQ